MRDCPFTDRCCSPSTCVMGTDDYECLIQKFLKKMTALTSGTGFSNYLNILNPKDNNGRDK